MTDSAVQPLVDLHCHGALGHELGRDAGGSREAAAHHRAAGVGRVVASLVSGTPDALVGQVFVPQATGDPRAIALRIAEIKGFIDIPWGQVVSDLLAHLDKDACHGE